MENKKLSSDANDILHDYIEGLLWVFDYYFNDMSYINIWYYPHERSPLLIHISQFLDKMTDDSIDKIHKNLSTYRKIKLSDYFNPIEQLIYVSPLVPDIINLLPSNYREFLTDDDLDPFLKSYFIDIKNFLSFVLIFYLFYFTNYLAYVRVFIKIV